jgi:hypothetical protein
MGRVALALVSSILLCACLGTTGNTIVHFRAAAAGPADAIAGAPLEFTSDIGWHVVLSKAVLHVGAMYLTEEVGTSAHSASPCIAPSTYVAEVTTDVGTTAGIDVDIVSPALHYFPNFGQGTNLEAKSGQVWLTGGDVNQKVDSTKILHIEGSADKGGRSVPFVGDLTISDNRIDPPTDATKPGSPPICSWRIVSPIPVDLVPENAGTLLLRIDPRALFIGVDFATLQPISQSPLKYAFANDGSTDKPLYQQLHSAGSVYRFSWQSTSP